MDDLNAQQIVLLTLLVSFVTSIATGITTVSLLEQAPEPVTQTINRVVEKTVERVVEVEGEGETERIIETVVVNEEELTIEAVQKNSSNIARVYNKVGDLETFVGIAVVVSDSGDLVMDAQKVFVGSEYIAKYKSGNFPVNIAFREANNPYAYLTINRDAVDEANPVPETFSSASFADSNNVQLGQSVITLSGRTADVVSTGIATSLETGNEEGSGISLIDTSVDTGKVVNGAILLNLSGEIIGVKINGDPARVSAFLPSNLIQNFLSNHDATI
jgi:hypothetical protein